MRPRILLTGFAPFGGELINPSWLAAQSAAAELRTMAFAAEAVELPCVFGSSARVLQAAIGQHRPSIVLCAGQAGGRSKIGLERVAINVEDARIPDNAGAQPVDTPVIDGGPAAYFSTLPLKAALQALNEEGFPAEISQTAGTYVCNSLFYALMHQLSGDQGPEQPVRGGFVHVPSAPEQVADGAGPSLSVGTSSAALVRIVRTTAETVVDLRLAAGAIS